MPKRRTSVAEFIPRFWASVDKSAENEHGCWLWLGAKDPNGYGRVFDVGVSGKRHPAALAHRVAYAIANGGKQPEAVCHHCDNPSCVRPDHLFGGTRADNNADMYRKGRDAWQTGAMHSPKGEQHPRAKLTDEHVREIRTLVGGGMRQRDVAVLFGVTQRAIGRIVLGIGWTHVH